MKKKKLNNFMYTNNGITGNMPSSVFCDQYKLSARKKDGTDPFDQ